MWQQCVLLLEVKTETTNKKKGTEKLWGCKYNYLS